MNSPVIDSLSRLIVVDKFATQALYLQIAEQLVKAIQQGYLPNQTKLPGTRQLSLLLKVHRKTIIATYDELETQGWLEIVPCKGTFVSLKNKSKKSISDKAIKSIEGFAAEAGFIYKRSNLLDNPFETSNCDFQITQGTTDFRLIHNIQFSKYYSTNFKNSEILKKNAASLFNNYKYKQQLSNFLNLSRALHISPEHLMLTSSAERSIGIVSELLLSTNDVVVVGELSHFISNAIFQKTGAVLQTVSIDNQGISTDYLEEICSRKKVRMLYLNPTHHFPTTVTLSLERRKKILELSKKYGFIILEHDFDADFNYQTQSLLPLASMDSEGMVVSVGTFGQWLPAGFSTGYVIAPKNLMEQMQRYVHFTDPNMDYLKQEVLSEMIADGAMIRYLKKSNKVYKQRRDLFAQLLQKNFKDDLSFQLPHGGLAFWLEFNQPINLMKWRIACLRLNLHLAKTLLFQNKDVCALRIGFAHLTFEEISKVVEIMYKAYGNLKLEKN